MEYLKINKSNIDRWNILNALYEPLLGIGSPIDRFSLQYSKDTVLYLPLEMQEYEIVQEICSNGGIEELAKKMEMSEDDLENAFNAERCRYDFEFWASSAVMIQTKEKGIIPFILNYEQRILLKEFELQRLAGMPIRVILLKHRQWGGSTLTQIYIAWIQFFHRKDWNAMIVADVQQQALNIRAMYERMITHHPDETLKILFDIDKIELVPYQGTKNIRIINGRNCIIGVGSVQEPESLRSFTTHLLHLSEVGLWQSTLKVNAESIAQTLYGGLVDAPYTFCVKESTAKGVGTYFHKEWLKASRGESNDKPVFIEWFRDSQYILNPLKLEGIKNLDEFVSSWTDYEKVLWDKGATVEHIAWRRKKIKDYTDDWRFNAEYPSTPEEAFNSSDSRIFPAAYVHNARKTCKPPKMIGNLTADSQKGADSLKNIRFIEQPNGYVKVWIEPRKFGIEKHGKMYLNRYCAFGDIGGTTTKADFSCITILDRIPILFGGVPVVAAEFWGHLDQDLFAWYGARLCKWYDNALYAIEVNSLREDQGDNIRGYGTDHSTTVLDAIKEHYDNLFYRIKPQQIQEKWDGVLGFHTNKSTKPMIIDALKSGLRDEEYEECSDDACGEFDLYEQKPDGSMGAAEGYHDDRVISRAGAIWLSSTMDSVIEIDIAQKNIKTGKKGNVATF